MNIDSYMMGDTQAKAVGRALKCTAAEKLQLANNRLNPKGALNILQNLSKNVKEINLSDNKLRDNSTNRREVVKKQQVLKKDGSRERFPLKYQYRKIPTIADRVQA